MIYSLPKILEHTLRLLIPDRDSSGNQVDTKPVVEEITKLIGSYFGGLQLWCATGIWEDGTGRLVKENVTDLQVSFSENQLAEIAATLMRFAALLIKNLQQAELAVKINGKLVIMSTGKASETVTHKRSQPSSSKAVIRGGNSGYRNSH